MLIQLVALNLLIMLFMELFMLFNILDFVYLFIEKGAKGLPDHVLQFKLFIWSWYFPIISNEQKVNT